MNKLPYKKEQLWQGCILASLSHAIMVAHYPDLSNEHSWDGINYNAQKSNIRGTVTFGDNYCIAAFRKEDSERIEDGKVESVKKYFLGAPKEVIELANTETLQYLLEEVKGVPTPIITSVFWGEKDLFSLDSTEEFLKNGGVLIETQIKAFSPSLEDWIKYYDMNSTQIELLNKLFHQKILHHEETIIMSKRDIRMIGTEDEDGLIESETSFNEMKIEWEK